jgi:hypothetical protein
MTTCISFFYWKAKLTKVTLAFKTLISFYVDTLDTLHTKSGIDQELGTLILSFDSQP